MSDGPQVSDRERWAFMAVRLLVEVLREHRAAWQDGRRSIEVAQLLDKTDELLALAQEGLDDAPDGV